MFILSSSYFQDQNHGLSLALALNSHPAKPAVRSRWPFRDQCDANAAIPGPQKAAVQLFPDRDPILPVGTDMETK